MRQDFVTREATGRVCSFYFDEEGHRFELTFRGCPKELSWEKNIVGLPQRKEMVCQWRRRNKKNDLGRKREKTLKLNMEGGCSCGQLPNVPETHRACVSPLLRMKMCVRL